MARVPNLPMPMISAGSSASTSGNKNYVYVGGICGTCLGYLDYVGVDKDVVVNAYAKSQLDPTSTVRPYVIAHAGGITNKEGMKGSLADALVGADIFIGVSAPEKM